MFAAKAPAPTRLEAMGLFALSKMLDPAQMLSTILPILEKADESSSGSVSKAVFTRVLREGITALTTADCDKVISQLITFMSLSFSESLDVLICCLTGAESVWLRRSHCISFSSEIFLDIPPPPSLPLCKRSTFHSRAGNQQHWR